MLLRISLGPIDPLGERGFGAAQTTEPQVTAVNPANTHVTPARTP